MYSKGFCYSFIDARLVKQSLASWNENRYDKEIYRAGFASLQNVDISSLFSVSHLASSFFGTGKKAKTYYKVDLPNYLK